LALSYQHHRVQAETNARNVATLLGESVAASLDRIDLGLRSVADEYQRQLAAGTLDERALVAFLVRQRARAPDVLSLRVADAQGLVREGAPAWPEAISVADREYFTALRADRTVGLHVSGPVMGRFIKAEVLLLSRRLSAPDGSFAGTVTGSIDVAHLAQMLSTVDVGPQGIVTLRGSDNSLLATNRDLGMKLGERTISPQLRNLLGAGVVSGTYEATSSLDGTRRVYAFARIDHYPLYVVVGLARNDYLAEWRRQVAGGVALAVCFALGSLAAAVQGMRALRRRARFQRLLLEQSESLRESEERFRTVFRTSPDAITLARLSDSRMVDVNDGFTQLTGWTLDEVRGRAALDLELWDDPADRDKLFDTLRVEGAVRNAEVRFRNRHGEILEALFSAQVVVVAGETLVLAVSRDIRDWKRAEQERDRFREGMRQAQKLESVGQLAGGIAHDFNNLLTVILSCTEAMRTSSDDRPPADLEALEEIGAAGERARDLTRQLLAFARKQVVSPVRLDLNGVVRQEEKLLRRTLREDIVLLTSLEEPLWPVWCDPIQIEQVLLNLAVNARDAMPSGGTLTIETHNVPDRDHGAGQAHDWVQLVVRDTGVGIPAAVQEHLFEPFFTTKPKGQGTGLGLATVHGIVSQNRGQIAVESQPGRGTTFELRFPRTDRQSAPTPSTRAPPVRGTETVLVVEDDPQVRNVTVHALGGAGYRVLHACNADEARALLRGRIEALQLLITDIVMPGESGRSLATELRRDRAELPVLYVSGYANEALTPDDVNAPFTLFLPKPFTPSSLLEHVRRLLDGLGATRDRDSSARAGD
jgi:PAS domain S-box-containing protein